MKGPGRPAMGGSSLLEVQLLLLILIGIDGALCRNIVSPWLGVDSKWPQVKKNFTKREVTCPKGQQRVEAMCCQLCPPGTKKTSNCKVDGGTPNCTTCTPGEDYMDHPHYYDKCLRCGLCDREHGLEVRKNCTILQNVVCGCAKNFFCNTPECKHCDPCAQCEHGVLEECTENRNTVCRVPGWRRKHQKDVYTLEQKNSENIPLSYADIDLSNFIPKIAEKMELDQVKKFVRKMGTTEVKIDQVKNDYNNDTGEQKFQLLKHWYESHGKKGAHRRLILGLRDIGLRVVAEELQDIIKTHPENEPENGNSSVLHSQSLASS
ncbi:tumor necrosis factor receptor superfamily member 6 isoform X2 [Trichosurus vulpecula]|uniref:tumor necrosis factor receptor superfamily member 6 isoform X2 n=1 Tax=Trichosurus vulpecula TaxID=9337 RepID=UPI00186AF878|nr:tumor necrosis factor receptor superfamily member 6 isoform X2 [Trichosurus vulpecula]